MQTVKDNSGPGVSNIMYIKGIPFVCPPTATAKKKQDPARKAQAKTGAGKSKTVSSTAYSINACCFDKLLPRSSVASGKRALFACADGESQARLRKSRRSVQVFSEEAVSIQTLRELMQIASWSPTGETPGLANFVMVEAQPSMDKVTKMAADWLRREGILADGVAPGGDARKEVFGGAPHMAVVHGREGSAEAARACALTAARLEWNAVVKGLGVCYAGEIVRAASDWPALAAALAIPTGHVVYAALFIGYPGFPAGQPEAGPRIRLLWL